MCQNEPDCKKKDEALALGGVIGVCSLLFPHPQVFGGLTCIAYPSLGGVFVFT